MVFVLQNPKVKQQRFEKSKNEFPWYRGVVNSIRRCTDLKSKNDFFRFLGFFQIFQIFFLIFSDFLRFLGFFGDFLTIFGIFLRFSWFFVIFWIFFKFFKTYSCEKRGKYRILLLNIHFKNSNIGSKIILIIKKTIVKR